MRIFISVDMEGISGVTRWQDVITAGQDYQRARHWMTADVNAAVAGARSAGATGFVVEENHGVEDLCNLLLDEIDPAVDVVRGLPRGSATTLAALTEPDERSAGRSSGGPPLWMRFRSYMSGFSSRPGAGTAVCRSGCDSAHI